MKSFHNRRSLAGFIKANPDTENSLDQVWRASAIITSTKVLSTVTRTPSSPRKGVKLMLLATVLAMCFSTAASSGQLASPLPLGEPASPLPLGEPASPLPVGEPASPWLLGEPASPLPLGEPASGEADSTRAYDGSAEDSKTIAKTPFRALAGATLALSISVPVAHVYRNIVTQFAVDREAFASSVIGSHVEELEELTEAARAKLTEEAHAKLTEELYFGFMIVGGTLALILLMTVLLSGEGLSQWKMWIIGAVVVVSTLGGSAITAAGFSASHFAIGTVDSVVTQATEHEWTAEWTGNATIWVGVSLVGVAFIIATIYYGYACSKLIAERWFN